MIKRLAIGVALPAVLVSTSPLAAQDALPQPASGTVEVRLTVEGTAEVPAQGYRLATYLQARQGEAGSPVPDRAAVIRQLEASEIAEREVCGPSFPYGFLGNEAAFVAEYMPDDEEALDDEATPDDEGLGAPVNTVADAVNALPQGYTGLFGSREAAEEARRLLRPHAGLVQIQPVLFDCAAANEAATMIALRNSRAEADTLARALGMRNAGVTRIEDASGDTSMMMLNALRSMQSPVTADTVEVPTTLNVTFRLER